MPPAPPDKITDKHLRAAVAAGGECRADKGLYLNAKGRSPSWFLRYTSPEGGRRREMSLGPYPDVGLGAAREQAAELRAKIRGGIDPIEQRERAAREFERTKRQRRTLREAACELHAAKKPGWRNETHQNQWISSLDHLGELMDMALADIEPADLFAMLRPLKSSIGETATRIRQRVEDTYDYAAVSGYVDAGVNPARTIKSQLKGVAGGRKGHHAALPWREIPGFLSSLRDGDASQPVRLAFEWLVLTATRHSETTGACWDEIDSDRAVWTIPAARMKTGLTHRVPITLRMREILTAIEPLSCGKGLIFASPQRRRGGEHVELSGGALRGVLVRMGLIGRATTHGMRAAFSTWAYETQKIRPDVIEAALAHVEKNAVKAAYSRADYWTERVALAHQWEAHCLGRSL